MMVKFHDPEGKLIARAENGDHTGYDEFEISALELIGPGGPHR